MNNAELKKSIKNELSSEREERRKRKAQLSALSPEAIGTAKAQDKLLRTSDKKAYRAALEKMTKEEKHTAKKHDKIKRRILRRPMTLSIWAVVLCVVVFAASSIVPIVMNMQKLGSAVFNVDSPEGDAARENGKVVAEAISDEGIVLLKNTDNLLPLTNGKINVFGVAAYNMRYGGGGSGGADQSAAINLFTGLENAGIEYNTVLNDFYLARKDTGGQANATGIIQVAASMMGKGNPDEPEIGYLSQDVLQNAQEYSSTAMIVLGSDGVEAADFATETLRLTANKKALVELVANKFENVIVVINAGNTMELGFLEEYPSVKSALWIGTPGPYGCNSLGKIIAGEVNPSGRLVDTYAYDVTSSPASVNFGDYKYNNIKGMSFINYNEGIYIGYRYYETFYKGDEAGYAKAVQFQFGYGLSYTDFEWETTDFTADSDVIELEVKVTNTGKLPGKDVVQAYFSAPYTEGGTEKSSIELAGYAKTGLLAAGESETVKISFATKDMASYDMNTEEAYVLDAGNYEIKTARNVHDIMDTNTYTVDKTVVYDTDEVTGTPIENRFDYADGALSYLSRSDWAGTYPDNTNLNYAASQEVIDAHKAKPEKGTGNLPTTGANNKIMLADMKGLALNDAK